MTRPADHDTPDDPRTGGGSSATAGVVMLVLSAVSQIATGAAAIGGYAAFEDNVRTIESNPSFGNLYLGLTGWGVLLVLTGLAALGAAWSLARHSPNGRVFGLGATILGLAATLLSLAIFHLTAFVSAVLLFATLYVLSYRTPT